MTRILKGTELRKKKMIELAETVREDGGRHTGPPTLMVVQIGNNPSDDIYRREIEMAVQAVEGWFGHRQFDRGQEPEVAKELEKLSNNTVVDGIILLASNTDDFIYNLLSERIDPKKDIDGITAENLGGIINSMGDSMMPATVKSVLHLLNYYNIRPIGKDILIIGKSVKVGLPLANYLTNIGATVTVAHSNTKDLKGCLKDKDIVITSVGKPNFITADLLGDERPIIIDVGISEVDGKVVGDIADDVKGLDLAYSPVPSGVGALTTVMLCENLIKAYKGDLE